MKTREGKIQGRFATTSFGLQQRVIKIPHCLHVLVSICAHKSWAVKWRLFIFRLGPRSSYRIAAFFTTLQCSPPQLAEGVIPRRERVVLEPLCVSKSAIVKQSLDVRLDTVLGIVRRPLRRAVEIDIKLNL